MGGIVFKDPKWSLTWLDAALEMEKEKYEKCPVRRDLVPGYVNARGWGYVVTGYFLLEVALKLLLHVNGSHPDKIHYLSVLFNSELKDEDQEVLREYYRDFRLCSGSGMNFRYAELDEFLVNLDGDRKGKDKPGGGRFVGSLDWRYYLIAEIEGGRLPFVSVEFLYEIAYGAARIIEDYVWEKVQAVENTYGWRKSFERRNVYLRWLMVRMNSVEWREPGDRIELYWGPDARGRYDYYVFRGGSTRPSFGTVPECVGLAVQDLRAEADAFRNQGFLGE